MFFSGKLTNVLIIFVVFNIVCEVILTEVCGVDDRFCREKGSRLYKFSFIICKIKASCRLAVFKVSLESFKEVYFGEIFFIALNCFFGTVDTSVNNFDIREDEFKVDRFDITKRIDTSVNVDDIGILETSYNVNYSVNLTDICEELVSKTFTL